MNDQIKDQRDDKLPKISEIPPHSKNRKNNPTLCLEVGESRKM